MDNLKVGKFIAKLRKAKHMTQQELGDLVGVGGKSVSKWECGNNMPDISIINKVSSALDVTSEELLNGEFNKDSKNSEFIKSKNTRKLRMILILITILIMLLIGLQIVNYHSGTAEYYMSSASPDFEVSGYLKYDRKGYEVNITRIYCQLDECKDIYVDSIEYQVFVNKIMIYRYNPTESDNIIDLNSYLAQKKILINEIFNNSAIEYKYLSNNKNNIYIVIKIINDKDDINNKYEINLQITDK